MTAGHPHKHSHETGTSVELNVDPQFEPGMRVMLRKATLEKYKRRPEYAENAEGIVEEVRGAYIPPTGTDARDGEYLYSIRFLPQEIWRSDHPEKNGSVYVDVWEEALEEP